MQAHLSHAQVEEGAELALDFEKMRKIAACDSPVIPVAVQHADTLEFLIIAYCNEVHI